MDNELIIDSIQLLIGVIVIASYLSVLCWLWIRRAVRNESDGEIILSSKLFFIDLDVIQKYFKMDYSNLMMVIGTSIFVITVLIIDNLSMHSNDPIKSYVVIRTLGSGVCWLVFGIFGWKIIKCTTVLSYSAVSMFSMCCIRKGISAYKKTGPYAAKQILERLEDND